MKAVVCYSSRHHGDPLKVLKAMEPESGLELLDVTAQQPVALEDYDCIGLALGIYAFGFHRAVTEFARQKLPHGKPVFFVYTYGGFRGAGSKAPYKSRPRKNCTILGEFCCRGYDTFGPFRLVGGLAKGHPNAGDLENARSFFRNLKKCHDSKGHWINTNAPHSRRSPYPPSKSLRRPLLPTIPQLAQFCNWRAATFIKKIPHAVYLPLAATQKGDFICALLYRINRNPAFAAFICISRTPPSRPEIPAEFACRLRAAGFGSRKRAARNFFPSDVCGSTLRVS